jgi:tRNA (guanine-N7-)-methyltransferase
MRLKRRLEPGPVLCEPAPEPARLDLAALFPVQRPLELEIGSGKGTFLVQEAAARPDTNFFGIEHMKKYAAYAADRCHRAGLDNVRVLGGDAVAFVRERVPDACVRVVHVYHPDPWPKARHHKRRIVRADFLPELVRILAPGGELRIVTDHPEYAEWIAAVLPSVPLETIEYVRPLSARENELVGTNFERKYAKLDGRPLHPFACRKPLAPR